MTRDFRRRSRALALVLTLLTAASCGIDAGTGVPATATSAGSLLGGLDGSSNTTLLQCTAPDTAQVATAIIGPLGGTLAIGSTSVVIPANAVLVPTTFRLTIPASPYVEIAVRAGDAEHFLFAQPVLMTIDYGRCAAQRSLLAPLTAWHIDETTKSLLEQMPSVDLPLVHTISFYTGHLSGYAVAD